MSPVTHHTLRWIKLAGGSSLSPKKAKKSVATWSERSPTRQPTKSVFRLLDGLRSSLLLKITGAPGATLFRPAPTETAILCVAPSVQNVQLTGSPHCTTSIGNIGGTITGTTGSVTLSFTSGYSSTSEFTVEIASQLSFSSIIEATIGIPELGAATVSDTIGLSVTNTNGKSFSTTINNEITQSITINVPQDSTCTLTEASSDVEFIATGWAWFNYATVVKGFHAYGLLIEALLPNESDRNSYMSFSGGINAASTGSYHAACV
ncbi:hypothetical protein B0H19DRAFT_1067156 [Mycena capillaripes]|nr:hypothetical protein B0H19DRAFT_1067156 [Mycena capillaripes]